MRNPSYSRPNFTRRDALRTLALTLGAGAVPGAFGLSGARAASPTPGATPSATPVPITSTALGDKLNLIAGAGGNIALLGGEDGALIVDCGLPNRIADTQAELRKAGAPTLLVNTHWHHDHTGGNEALAKAGARIVAHENCRTRLSTEQYVEAMDRRLPVQPAHTDTDVVVHLQKADLIHTGDLYFNGGYPFIDYSSRGRLDGLVAVIREVIALAGPKTRIIPGHGPLATTEELKSYLGFLETMLERFNKLKAEGKTVDEAVAAAPAKEFDEKLGKAFVKPESFVRITYTGLLR